MSCPTGQIQVGVNPQTTQPICVDFSVINGTTSSQTGGTKGSWWSQILNNVPDILGGVADVISAKKGQNVLDTIVLQSTPPIADSKPNINWGWIILSVVVVAAVGLVLVLKKKNSVARFTCNTRNFWCWSKKCKAAKKCACNVCSELKAINPNLYDACIDSCQEEPRPTDPNKYLCQNIGPEILFNRYGVVMCGFDPYEETLEGDLYKKTEAAKVENQSFETNIMIGLGALLLILIISFVWK